MLHEFIHPPQSAFIKWTNARPVIHKINSLKIAGRIGPHTYNWVSILYRLDLSLWRSHITVSLYAKFIQLTCSLTISPRAAVNVQFFVLLVPTLFFKCLIMKALGPYSPKSADWHAILNNALLKHYLSTVHMYWTLGEHILLLYASTQLPGQRL